ncbi:hypothetical protein B0H14DRAFT_2582687 [Mycena olivaceomarginata]|nr:hypothetical protein B0H14DRAFT_2582687 [Mycena olivaceomarginata]
MSPLIFIGSVVLIHFAMAVMFTWFFSHKLSNFPKETYEERMAWRQDQAKGEKRKMFLPERSRFTLVEGLAGGKGRPTTAYGPLDLNSSSNYKCSTVYAGSVTPSSGHSGSGTPPSIGNLPSGDRRSHSLMPYLSYLRTWAHVLR